MERIAVQNELKSIVSNHIPVNCKQYYWSMCDNTSSEGFFGGRCDMKPFEGKVIHLAESVIFVKKSRNKFVAVDGALVTQMPSIGDTVKVTPYARKHFDGKRTDAPIIEKSVMPDDRVVEWKKTIIGSVKTQLPLPNDRLQCPELQEMVSQIENLNAPDGHRTIAQMLYDAGAKDFELVDPSPENIIKTPPRLRFTVDNRKHSGQVDVIYDRGMDTYRVELLKNGEVTESTSGVYFDDLGSILGQAIDDGSWNKIEIEILKSSKKRRLH